MKKLLFLLTICLGGFLASYSQNYKPMTVDDHNLFKNHPHEITDDQAADLLTKRETQVENTKRGYYESYTEEKDWLGLKKLEASKKKSYIFLSTTDVTGEREWLETKNYFFPSYTRENRYFYIFCIAYFILIFLFLLPIINFFGDIENGIIKWSSKKERRKITRAGLKIIGISGMIIFVIYFITLSSNLKSGERFEFQILEPIIFITGSAISFFLYLALLSAFYWIIKKIKIAKNNNLVAS